MEYNIGFKYGDKEYSFTCESPASLAEVTNENIIKDFLHENIKGYINSNNIRDEKFKPKNIRLSCKKTEFCYGTENLNNHLSESDINKFIENL